MTQQHGRSSQVGVNLPELIVCVDYDRDLLCELIGIFTEEFPRLLRSLQQFVVCGDTKNVEATMTSPSFCTSCSERVYITDRTGFFVPTLG
jgi:hypothetical protein